jgi:hypothetical protein
MRFSQLIDVTTPDIGRKAEPMNKKNGRRVFGPSFQAPSGHTVDIDKPHQHALAS